MEIIIIISCIILSAFFSGVEIAYISTNRIHIEIQKNQNNILSRLLGKITKNPSKFMITMLLGNALALIVYGLFFGEWIVLRFFPEYTTHLENLPAKILLLQTVISTLVILITAEFLPKILFRIYSNTLLKICIIPSYLFYLLFTPFTAFLMGITNFVMKYIFKSNTDTPPLSFTKIELNHYISEQMDIVDSSEDIDNGIEIFRNALNFTKVKARDVMIPRTDILTINIEESPKKLSSMFIESGYSKILVFNETIDDIVGYVHSFDLFKKPKNIKNILKTIDYVPEAMFITNILNMFIQKRKSIAVILDEFGGTSGIITMEDIVEELFGDIQDEHDNEDFTEEKVGDNEFHFSARLEVEYINKTYKTNLPEEESYETLGGLIVSTYGHIPSVNDVIHTDGFEFTILEGSETKIDMVHMRVITD